MDTILIEQLKVIRNNPRMMHEDFLKKQNLFDIINDTVPYDNFKIKEKIDVIINEHTFKCYCGNLSKLNSNWCSITCRNKDISIRASISKKNTDNSLERLELAKQTRIKKYGVSSVQDIPEAKEKTRITRQKYVDELKLNTFKSRGLDINKLSDHIYLKTICDNSTLFDVQRTHFNNIPVTTVVRHFNRIGFDPKFKRGSSSNGEQELFKWVTDAFPNETVIANNRKLIGKEIDVLIESKNIGIEYHGLYWHSLNTQLKKGNNKNYHKEKFEAAKSKGVTLLQFFEDEWFYKKQIVKSIISSKMGVYQDRFYARQCTMKKVSREEAKNFLEETHIQGFANGSYYGLYYNNSLLSLIGVGKSRFENAFELIRFSTKLNTQVIGGFSKLLSAIKHVYSVEELVTYADLRYSTGNVYEKLGSLIKQTPPGYYWVNPNSSLRINRFQTQKSKLGKLLGNNYDPSITEVENMENNNYAKIYDCGNYKYIIKLV